MKKGLIARAAGQCAGNRLSASIHELGRGGILVPLMEGISLISLNKCYRGQALLSPNLLLL